MKVKIKKLHPNAVIPRRMRPGDAGLDLTCVERYYDEYTHTFQYEFGIAIQLEPGYFGMIVPRSSIYKYNLTLSNSCGILDENYTGELKAFFRCNVDNFKKANVYNIGDRIAQLIVLPYPLYDIEEVTELSDTNRGVNGFGSSGV